MDNLVLHPVATDNDWKTAVSIRQVVFVTEQACSPELEWDEFDAVCTHYIAMLNEEPIGTARFRETTLDGQVVAKLERFAVLKEFRGRGFGKQLVQRVISKASEAGYETMFIHAQAYLQDMYENLGFERVGDIFDEAGIPHISMVLTNAGKERNKVSAPQS